nr:hypothetical protein Iba_chr07eCG5490 [Ipomoea batatas]
MRHPPTPSAIAHRKREHRPCRPPPCPAASCSLRTGEGVPPPPSATSHRRKQRKETAMSPLPSGRETTPEHRRRYYRSSCCRMENAGAGRRPPLGLAGAALVLHCCCCRPYVVEGGENRGRERVKVQASLPPELATFAVATTAGEGRTTIVGERNRLVAACHHVAGAPPALLRFAVVLAEGDERMGRRSLGFLNWNFLTIPRVSMGNTENRERETVRKDDHARRLAETMLDKKCIEGKEGRSRWHEGGRQPPRESSCA